MIQGVAMKIGGRDAILQKVVFELRCRNGYTYLDSCGRTVNTIMREQPEWVLRSESASPQNAPLLSLRNSCIFNFSSLKCDLSIERAPDKDPLGEKDVEVFAEQAENLHAIVADCLGLREFTRIGFRAWYIFGCSSSEDSEKWLLGLGCYQIGTNLRSAFDNAEVESGSLSVVIVGEDRKFRIAFNGVELQAQIDFGSGILSVRPRDLPTDQHRVLLEQERVRQRMRQMPEFAAMIDIDAFQEEPLVVAPKDFITTSCREFLPRLQKACAH